MSTHPQTSTSKWYVASTGNHQGLVIDEETSDNIAVAYDKANAALIAAAPALYEALKRLQSVVRDEYHLLDIRKRPSLCLADTEAGTALRLAEGRN